MLFELAGISMALTLGALARLELLVSLVVPRREPFALAYLTGRLAPQKLPLLLRDDIHSFWIDFSSC
jgi:hypothetical protein